jgi:hypothetical protein
MRAGVKCNSVFSHRCRSRNRAHLVCLLINFTHRARRGFVFHQRSSSGAADTEIKYLEINKFETSCLLAFEYIHIEKLKNLSKKPKNICWKIKYKYRFILTLIWLKNSAVKSHLIESN